MLIEELTTEYLILHEDEADWDAISKCKERDFSLPEIRMFRKKINWPAYLISHKDVLSTTKLEVASKHFTSEVYDIIIGLNIGAPEFLLAHAEKLNYRLLIQTGKPSPELLIETVQYWKNLEGIVGIFNSAKNFNINDAAYSEVKLILETL